MTNTTNLTEYDLSERLRAALKMEMQCADIYHSLITLYPRRLFPEAGDLFETLAEWEDRHADIISVSIGYSKIGGIPDIIVPHELSMINKTLDITRDISNRIGAERITLNSALDMVLQMEESMGESYLHEVMTKKTDSEAISYLQQFFKDEKTHVAMIQEFMVRKKFIHQPRE